MMVKETSGWINLTKPPISVALFQLKFEMGDKKLVDFLINETLIRHYLPQKNENVHAQINMPRTQIPLGISKITGTSDAKITEYVFFTKDQKRKLSIQAGSVTYVDETPYEGWDKFIDSVRLFVSFLSEPLSSLKIIRTSIRFINTFNLPKGAEATEYFNTTIAGREQDSLPYPLSRYSYRLIMDIPDSDIYAIVNQSFEENLNSNYVLDIDVLDNQNLMFDIETILLNLTQLRKVKNKIFFNGITSKTIELCK